MEEEVTPDPMTEEAPYRVTSKAPEGLKAMDDNDGNGVRFLTAEGEIVPVLEAMQRGWIDTAPVHRKRAPAKPLSIYAAMVAIIKEMPALGKTQRNASQGFNFRGVDAVLDHLNPLLGKHGVFFVPECLERVAETRITGKGNNLWTVHLRVRFTFYAVDGSSVSATTWGEGTDSGDKATSKAHTMALKSALNEVFAISDNEVDPDSEGEPSTAAQDQPPEPPADSVSAEDRAGFKRDIATLRPDQKMLLKSLWTGANIPPLDHPYLRETHIEGIVALLNQVLAVPEPEAEPAPSE